MQRNYQCLSLQLLLAARLVSWHWAQKSMKLSLSSQGGLENALAWWEDTKAVKYIPRETQMYALLLLEFLNKVKWILQTSTSTKAKVDLRNLFSLPIFLQAFLSSWQCWGYCRLKRWAFQSPGYPVIIGGFPWSSQIWEDQLVPPTARRKLWRFL